MNKEEPSALRIKIASKLRKQILSGEIKSGEELSLTDTALEMGISRTPVREAFQALENDGLISLRMNRGAIVNNIDEHFITDHFEMRILLESEASSLAAKNGIEDIDSLIEECLLLRDKLLSKDDSSFCDTLNQKIHTTIWRAADNRKLYSILCSLWNGPSIGRNTNELDHHYMSNLEHLEILQAIKRLDCDNARRGMKRHIERSMDNILSSYHEREKK